MLDGIKILDMTWVLGGPFAGQTLAQLGADVIKVETLKGDMSRQIPPYEFEGDSSFFLSVNRGKRSIALDLKNRDGKRVLDDLVREADAVIYGFAPDVPRRLGVDHDSLLALNPEICLGELIGLHDSGAYAKAPAFDLIVQAIGGVMGITGAPEGPPARVGYQVADLAGGLYLALGTVGALLGAARSGQGRRVQVSLLDCQLALLTWQAQNYFISGDIPKAEGARHPMIAPSDVFLCADDRYLAVSPTGDAFWAEFCEAIGRQDLAADSRFSTAAKRISNVESLTSVLVSVFALRASSDWTDDLFRRRIPAGPVYDIGEALSQPLATLRSMVEVLSHPRTGKDLQFLGNPFKFAGAHSLSYPPPAGAHTREILRTICGYSDDDIDALASKGAIATSEEQPR